ncbi:acyl-CoA dehydrogenase family protein [Bremerella sp. T1]|uniref:acyl-CoA dehydrogenase family protein n=1 Tax=Bremerella sp. TYQ1 TaxID=3119568 RepID=UPI001CC96672|nr:acyl-CoA dehydrogenase family protein [Bremerella volcania]UBM35737.1 acyl-CoA/acyl-ACP dehydrogenase [Bremerella volcania]
MSSDTTNPSVPETKPDEQHETSFAETALKLGGKSEDEARRTGAIDSADDQVEKLFQPQYQTANSPAHRAVWDRGIPTELFESDSIETAPEIRKVMDDSLEVVRGFQKSKSITDEKGKIRDEVLQSLGEAGYWGLLVDKKYGGSGTPFRSFAPFLTEMAMVDPTLAGLASVHGCIGAVDPVSTFGNEEQKQRYLPKLASGERLSAFALTEPCAGSDLTALKTSAKLDGDSYILNGEKLFITNVVPGRTIGVVCLIDDVPAVLVVDLPPEENANFQLRKYGIWALKHTYNQGIIFKDFRVPKENLLLPGKGNGLTIAYHGLNLGRISLCANAAGTMRLMMASMIPWVHFRETYGEPIAKRELVQRRLGKLAGMIVASDALVAWCSTLIDSGYRGEMECIIAKIFGSESQKEAAIELFMKTHGGRSFLHGHMFGDNVHEYLAPCIYEGEGEMLGMAFFKSLVKKHGTQFFEPIGKALHAAGIKKPNPLNPAHAWALKGALAPYASWMMKEYMGGKPRPKLPSMPDDLKAHAQFAADRLQDMPLKISGTMRKHQLKLADRQCRMSYLSQNVQDLMTILCTALYAAKQDNETVRAAADIACRDLKRKILLTPPSDRYFRRVSEVGGMIAEGNFPGVSTPPDEIMMRYDK